MLSLLALFDRDSMIQCEISTNTRNGLRCIRNRTKSTQLFYFLNSSLCNWDKLTFPPMLLHSDSHLDRSKARVAFDLLITWMDLRLEWCSLRSYQSRRAAHLSDSRHVMNLQMSQKERHRLGWDKNFNDINKIYWTQFFSVCFISGAHFSLDDDMMLACGAEAFSLFHLNYI